MHVIFLTNTNGNVLKYKFGYYAFKLRNERVKFDMPILVNFTHIQKYATEF